MSLDELHEAIIQRHLHNARDDFRVIVCFSLLRHWMMRQRDFSDKPAWYERLCRPVR
jgi:hypothetical protein